METTKNTTHIEMTLMQAMRLRLSGLSNYKENETVSSRARQILDDIRNGDNTPMDYVKEYFYETEELIRQYWREKDNNVSEDYCPYELARLLQEKGFKGPCPRLYTRDGKQSCDDGTFRQELCQEGECAAPTMQTATAWIREKQGFHIHTYHDKSNTWTRQIQELSTGVEWTIGGFKTPQEATEEAIRFTLQNLIG